MQVYAATLAQLVRDDAKLAIIFADREARQLAPAAESRVVRLGHETAWRAETKGVDQLWTRIRKLIVLRLSGQV